MRIITFKNIQKHLLEAEKNTLINTFSILCVLR